MSSSSTHSITQKNTGMKTMTAFCTQARPCCVAFLLHRRMPRQAGRRSGGGQCTWRRVHEWQCMLAMAICAHLMSALACVGRARQQQESGQSQGCRRRRSTQCERVAAAAPAPAPRHEARCPQTIEPDHTNLCRKRRVKLLLAAHSLAAGTIARAAAVRLDHSIAIARRHDGSRLGSSSAGRALECSPTNLSYR